MIISKLCQIWRACPAASKKAPFATSISAPYLDTEDPEAPRLVATDGHVLAAIPVELEEGDTAGPVPVDALREAVKGKKTDPAVLRVNGSAELPDGRSYPREDAVGRFPTWRKVIPGAGDKRYRVALNPFLLADLALALGVDKSRAPGVVLTFHANPDGSIDAGAPVRVALENDSEPVGVIMPRRID